jgi:hypothetical protein
MLPHGYAQMSRDDRVAHWVGWIHRGMRWTGESGTDELAVFEPALLDRLRADDSDIDALMPTILTYLARMWGESPAAFLGQANARMGSRYPVDSAAAAARLGSSDRT